MKTKRIHNVAFDDKKEIFALVYAASNLVVGAKLNASGSLIVPTIYDIDATTWHIIEESVGADDKPEFRIEREDMPEIAESANADELIEMSQTDHNVLLNRETGWFTMNDDTIYNVVSEQYAKIKEPEDGKADEGE